MRRPAPTCLNFRVPPAPTSPSAPASVIALACRALRTVFFHAAMPATPESTIDAVLPLTVKDLDRAQLLFESLDRFMTGLGRLFVLLPEAQVKAVRDQVQGDKLVFMSELEVAPELAWFPGMQGWYKQQLLKLAVADHIQTAYYLTFDADVIATRALSPETLLQDGKAPCYVIPEDLHPKWYTRTAKLLKQPLRQTGIVHNVTPALLARAGVNALAEHFEARYQAGDWAKGLRRPLMQRYAKLRFGHRSQAAGWRLFLAAGLPWTEYALYYSFLEAYDLFDRWHVKVDRCIYDIERSVWYQDRDGFKEHWDPKPLFEGEGPPFFVVLQSNTKLPVADIRSKLGPWL